MTRAGRLGVATLALVAGCGGAAPDEPAAVARAPGLFVDVAAEQGFTLVPTSGAAPPTAILEVKSGGVALFDWRGDGDLDVFVPNGATLDAPERGPGARLVDVRPGLALVDATDAAALDFARWGMGTAAGDLDGDGSCDLFVAAFGPDAVLLQDADGRLPEALGALAGDDAGWSSGVALGDLDADGDLDAYVARYLAFDPAAPPPPTEFLGVEVFGGPAGLAAVPDHLWVNDGGARFAERAADAGLHAPAAAHGLGVAILDLDDDGRLDAYVGNDSMADFAFVNRGGLRFEERGAALGLATGGDGRGQATMGIAVADVNDDGRPDLFTTNFSHDTNTLRVSIDGGRWRDASTLSGLASASRPYCGWSAAFADFDLDGAEELVAFNGHVYPEAAAERVGSSRLQPPLYFERDGERFRHVADQPWLALPHCDRGAAFGDLDGDGDVDVAVVDLAGPLRVLANGTSSAAAPSDAWVTVALADTRDLGARVELESPDGRAQRRWLASGLGYQSSSAPAASFGVGPDPGPFRVRVRWPDGSRSVLEGVPRGTRVDVARSR